MLAQLAAGAAPRADQTSTRTSYGLQWPIPTGRGWSIEPRDSRLLRPKRFDPRFLSATNL
jgi:hypothetical protein